MPHRRVLVGAAVIAMAGAASRGSAQQAPVAPYQVRDSSRIATEAPPDVDRTYATLDPKSREIVQTYLKTDCEIGEGRRAIDAVLEVAFAVRPYLDAVRRGGPPSADLREFAQGVDATWRDREAYLKTADAKELGPDMYSMMTMVTRTQYNASQARGIQAKYRERAVLALRAIDAKRPK